ncbi:MAG: type II secretion system ATPase GspE [Candidatus Aureabacteria bacterium]|nr:type II secretion system ATPase GspE [Candidatus Auribacterota bacterium]NLW94352.1 type II secretion system ATPase GspE [Chlamydiota bacterium]
MSATSRKLIGQILLKNGCLTPDQLDEGLAKQENSDKRLGDILIALSYIKEDDLLQALSEQFGLPFLKSLPPESADRELIGRVPRTFAQAHQIVPLRREGDAVVVATADPLNTQPLDDIGLILECETHVAIARAAEISHLINTVYMHAESAAEELIEDMGAEKEAGGERVFDLSEQAAEDLMDLDDKAPVIKLVNLMIYQAAKSRASDIHIEPYEKELKIRFRIDGVLHNTLSPPKRYQSAIISRVKIMSNMNIAEKRLPQDGRIKIKMPDREIDLRVSTIPIVHGERVVMRLLDRGAMFYGLEEMGFSPDKLERFSRLIALPYGIILVTGPTGSGKSTTLYGALSRINTEDRNILTIEDPVEYQIPGIGQIHVKPKINLTFASGLRHILRQDPDVIMVGEIRDLETAEIAIQASLTGHLVFSTLHTNDAAGAITRLIDMGVEPFLVSSSVIAIMAQRLVRVICPKCRERYVPPPETLRALGLSPADLPDGTVSRGKGCDHCMGTGYRGRSGIFELLVIDDEIRQLVLDRISSNVIKKTALGKGMLTLRGDGAQKVAKGITTIEEVLRITQEEVFEV